MIVIFKKEMNSTFYWTGAVWLNNKKSAKKYQTIQEAEKVLSTLQMPFSKGAKLAAI